MNHRQKRRTIIISVLVMLVISIVTLTVVYAALSATLTVTGSTDVVAATWDVHFENAAFVTSLSSGINTTATVKPLNYTPEQNDIKKLADSDGGQVTCTPGQDCITSSSPSSISFSATNLTTPGDFKAIQFDVVNAGSIDAKLDGTVLSGLSTAQDVYLNYYVQYSDGTTIKSGDILSKGTRKTLLLVIEFDENITASQLPTTNQSLSLSYTMNYIQK